MLFWIVPNILTIFLSKDSSLSLFLRKNLSPPIVGIFFASLLFLLPLSSNDKILTRKDTSQIDWASLLLFGAGLSLGKILFKTELSSYISSYMTVVSGMTGETLLLMGIVIFTIFFTELVSNTASANIIIPIVIAFTKESGGNSLLFTFVLALACNSAYMLPVATPPNVIVYGTNKVRKLNMVRNGFILNIICAFFFGLIFLIFS